jgi:hypothetical protein
MAVATGNQGNHNVIAGIFCPVEIAQKVPTGKISFYGWNLDHEIPLRP